jgi:hypothetical protein
MVRTGSGSFPLFAEAIGSFDGRKEATILVDMMTKKGN